MIVNVEVKQKEQNKALYRISKSMTWRDVAGDKTEACKVLQDVLDGMRGDWALPPVRKTCPDSCQINTCGASVEIGLLVRVHSCSLIPGRP